MYIVDCVHFWKSCCNKITKNDWEKSLDNVWVIFFSSGIITEWTFTNFLFSRKQSVFNWSRVSFMWICRPFNSSKCFTWDDWYRRVEISRSDWKAKSLICWPFKWSSYFGIGHRLNFRTDLWSCFQQKIWLPPIFLFKI